MVAALTLVGCASGAAEEENDTDASGAASAVDAELQALLPEDLREGGSIAVGSSLAAPPTNFIDENEKPIGLYVEALELAGSKLGITIEWVQIPFSGLIAAIESGRIDGAVPFSTTPVNLNKLDVVPIAAQAQGMLIEAGNPDGIEDFEDLCGLKLAHVVGSLPAQEAAEALAVECAEAGLPTLEVLSFPSFAETSTAISSGRADAQINTNIGVLYEASRNDAFEVVLMDELKEKFGAFPQGLGFSNADPTLGEAVAAALADAQDKGELLPIMEKYNLDELALEEAITLVSQD